jgi:hypothetical protein
MPRLGRVYPASEGFIAAADRGPGQGLRLIPDNGLFYEFVPLAELAASTPTRHSVANIELGLDYAIAVTSCAGLWAYVMGDTVKFVEHKAPRLLVTGRTSYTLSSFGEHLMGGEIEDAVSAAASAIGAQIADFAVSRFPGRQNSRGESLPGRVQHALPNAPRRSAFSRSSMMCCRGAMTTTRIVRAVRPDPRRARAARGPSRPG